METDPTYRQFREALRAALPKPLRTKMQDHEIGGFAYRVWRTLRARRLKVVSLGSLGSFDHVQRGPDDPDR